MKKKGIIAAVVVIAIVGSLFIAPVQTLAVNLMGVFRVSDPNVINISTQDLTDIAQNVQALMNSYKQQDSANGQTTDETAEAASQTDNSGKQDASDTLKQYEKTLGSASDFKAFSLKLPTYFKDQTPAITEIDPPVQTVTIDTASVNKALAALQSSVTLPDSLNGRKVTITSSPVVLAQYADAVCFAAKKPSFDLPGKLDSIIPQILTTLPLIPADIQTQIANINLFDNNIYLPNVEGVTKTANLGGNTGYIYAVDDMTALGGSLLPMLQSGMGQPSSGSASTTDTLTQTIQKYSGYEVIVWVKGGVLYGVAGKYTDDQLAAIAKSMQ